MNKLILSLGLVLLVTACAANTPQPGHETLSQALNQAGGAANVQSSKGGPTLVCSRTPEIGYHIIQIHCITQEEAAARQKADQEAMRNLQHQSSQGPGMGNGPPL